MKVHTKIRGKEDIQSSRMVYSNNVKGRGNGIPLPKIFIRREETMVFNINQYIKPHNTNAILDEINNLRRKTNKVQNF